MSQALHLSSSTNSIEEFERLKSTKSVSTLTLKGMTLDEDFIDAFSKLLATSNIAAAEIRDCPCNASFQSTLQMAEALGNVTDVLLTNNSFLSAEFFEKLMGKASSITSLRVQEELDDSQVRAIARGLRESSSLTSLDLYRSKVQSLDILADGLGESDCLEFLGLRGMGLDQENSSSLLEALQNHKRLRTLDLSFNKFEGLTSVSQFLSTSSAEDIELSYQNIWGTSKVQIASLMRALQNNGSLKRLALAKNKIDGLDCIEIADMLRANKTLECLALEENKIDDKGVEKIAEALEYNPSLEALKISRNPFRKDGSTALLRVLKMNSTLGRVDVNDNAVAGDRIRRLASLNKSGRKLLQDNPPLALWPAALARVGSNITVGGSLDMMLHFVRGPALFEGTLCLID